MRLTWSLRSKVAKKLATAFVLLGAAVLISGTAIAQCTSDPTTTVNSTNGTFTLLPGVPTAYQTQVNPPIAADGSSNFPAKRGVIPIQFSLSSGPGPVVFQSIGSNGYYGWPLLTGGTVYADDCSYLTFTPTTPFTFSQLTTLSAVYTFTEGDCHGGSLRWSVTVSTGTSTGNILIYYGLPQEVGNGSPATGGCNPNDAASGGQGQSGTNLIRNSAIQYDTSQLPGGAYYSNYADAMASFGSLEVTSVTLVLDSGWQQGPYGSGGDQMLTLGNVNVSTSVGTGTTDTFSPPTGPVASTCTLPAAQIRVVQTSGSDPGAVNDVVSASAADTGDNFRVVDCKYMYNLDVSTLPGAGTYSVTAWINGMPAGNPATFMLK